jgi:drug/metabolite transporter (DMT)-like permease
MNALILGLVALPAALVAFALEGRRKNVAPPNQLPYTWGFYIGMSGMLLGIYALFFAFYTSISGAENASISASVYLFFAAVWGPAGYFAIKRRKWAWVVSTIASCNPVWWIANSVYGHNRWNEFDGGVQ